MDVSLPQCTKDIEVYNRHQANVDEWQASIKETPVDPNTRLGKQIYGTVQAIITQRDSTAK